MLYNFREAAQNTFRMGRRAVFALIGIVVGSASIVALSNIGSSAEWQSSTTLNQMGSNVIVAYLSDKIGTVPLPLNFDVEQLRQDLSSADLIVPVSKNTISAEWNGNSISATVVASTAELADLLKIKLYENGRFISAYDGNSAFAVIGSGLTKQFSAPGHQLQAGDGIQLGNYIYKIIGVAQPALQNPLVPIDVDNSIIIPRGSFARLQPNASTSVLILRKTAPRIDLRDAEQFQYSIISHTGDRQITTRIPEQLLVAATQQSRIFSILLSGMGIISLIAGGVGVMNVMLANVAQRRKEIGLRMAVGALSKDILILFLIEAGMLCFIGSIIGTLLGIAVAKAVTVSSNWSFHISYISIPMGILTSIVAGICFGLYPAISASRLSPVEALRDV